MHSNRLKRIEVNQDKKNRTEIEDYKFAISDNYYFLFGSVTVEDYEDDIEFMAEANAYENLDVYAFNQICWPDYLDTETKVKILYLSKLTLLYCPKFQFDHHHHQKQYLSQIVFLLYSLISE